MEFDTIRENLLRGGVAPRHVRRYLAELDDHLADLTARETDAGYDQEDATVRARAALGDDAALAKAMLNQPKLRSITARAPWLVFGIVPPLAAILVFVVPTLTLVLIGKTHGLMTSHAPPAPLWFQQVAAAVTLMSNLLLPLLLATLLVFVAARQRLLVRWPLIGTALIALMGVQLRVNFPVPGHGPGSIMLTSLVVAGPRGLHKLLAHWPLLLAQWVLIPSPLIWFCLARGQRTA